MVSVTYSQKELIRKHLYRIITTGRPGDKLPSEKQLCDLFDVARGTVRAAIKELINEGCVVPRKGTGVFINSETQLLKNEKLIGIICNKGRQAYHSYYHGMMLSGIIRQISQKGHSFIHIENFLDSSKWAGELEQQNLHGLLWLNPCKEHIETLSDSNIPMVALGTYVIDTPRFHHEAPSNLSTINGVFIDNFKEGYNNTLYLLHKGFKKILLPLCREYDNLTSLASYKGIETALKDNNLTLEDNFKAITSGNKFEHEVVDSLHQGYTGIYCDSKLLAQIHRITKSCGFIHGKNYCLLARTSQLDILCPDILFDKVDNKLEEIGKRGVNLLLKAINTPDMEPEHIYIEPEIIPTNQAEDN